MSSNRPSNSEIKCDLLFKMTRGHGWGSPFSKQDLVSKALESTEQGRGKDLVEELLNEQYIGYQRGKGYSIKNNPDDQARAAFRLRDTCRRSELRSQLPRARWRGACQ